MRRPSTRSRRLLTAVAAGLLLVAGPAVALRTSPALALNNGVARTPPMGWNSWNTFGCNISEALIRQMTDAMVSSGMKDAGYQYVVVDDCWMNPNRDSAGNLQGDPTRFPSGMKALGDYIHARGLKFG
ncbi:alpha-galactosidase, partial [Micromonospora humida]|uniref:alpha-galactosidase n=1 Tax=Micromonospora humida TaxID=2809018 RepID=UPI00366B675A